MMIRRFFPLALTLSLLLGGACKEADTKDVRAFGKDDKPVVMAETLQPRTLMDYITLSGKLEGITDITMSSETSGRILRLFKKLGDKVVKGDRIGLVDNEVMRIRLEQAEAAKTSAEAALETAQLNLTTSETLFQKKTISQAEYNSALSAFKAAKAALDGAKANLEAAQKAYDNSYLLAPEAGVITNLTIVSGQYLNMGQQVCTITDDSSLLIKTGVSESQVGKLRQGQPVEVFALDSDKPVRGSIRGFGIRPLTASANYPVEIQLPKAGGLLPGKVVSVKITGDVYANKLYTSINNIVKEYDRNYVYLVGEGDKVSKREVKLGTSVGEQVILLSGTSAGDRIVTSGMENLQDGTAVTVRN